MTAEVPESAGATLLLMLTFELSMRFHPQESAKY